MRDLPSGTVTFLFTDVEGSTKLLHELGAGAYAEALLKHRRVVREAFSAHGGVEVDTQGDAFFVAFPTAPGALAAAAAALEDSQRWSSITREYARHSSCRAQIVAAVGASDRRHGRRRCRAIRAASP